LKEIRDNGTSLCMQHMEEEDGTAKSGVSSPQFGIMSNIFFIFNYIFTVMLTGVGQHLASK